MVNPYGGFYAVRHSGWLPNSSQARWKPTANVPKRNSTTMTVCVYGWISVSRPQKRGESIMCILYWRLFPLGILQNKKIRTRLSSNKRTSKHMTRQALTSGLNPSMYKATRSPPQGIRIPKISTILCFANGSSFLPVISKPPTLPHRFVQCITAASHSQAREQQASQPRHTLFF